MEPRFLLDAMLGSLTRWLRIGGYDTEYRIDIMDEDLIEKARIDERILLTRDEELAHRSRKQGIESLYLKSVDTTEELREIIKVYQIKLDASRSRCPICNETLDKVSKEKVKGKVPEKTWVYVNDFWECQNCGRIYWKGSHWIKITKTIEDAMKPC